MGKIGKVVRENDDEIRCCIAPEETSIYEVEMDDFEKVFLKGSEIQRKFSSIARCCTLKCAI